MNLNPHIIDFHDFILAYKPSGMATHSPDVGKYGFQEWLSHQLKMPLFTFQRLDKGTSGLILFAKNKEAAERFTQYFKTHQVQKKYLLIVRASGRAKSSPLMARSKIEKIKDQFISTPLAEGPHETRFVFLKARGGFELWLAEPKTGKTHQIRLHARDLGMPILGDTEYGGADFFRLSLHAHEMLLPESDQPFLAPAPLFFYDLEMLKSPFYCQVTEALHRRLSLYGEDIFKPELALRLVHDEVPGLRIDKLGEVLWLYLYSEDIALSGDIKAKLLEMLKAKSLVIKHMKNRGGQSFQSEKKDIEVAGQEVPERWPVWENGICYEMRLDQGHSPGLFLDQRENRKWLISEAKGKRVLNLFSYTGGFSLAAALGGALEVITVDVSKKYLEWSKANFTLNQLNPEKYLFYAQDALEFLKIKHKHKTQFDLIICDPPSFARLGGKTKGRGGAVFRLWDDLPDLLQSLDRVLAPNGLILFSCNLESIGESELLSRILKLQGNWQLKPLGAQKSLDHGVDLNRQILKAFCFAKG